MTFGILKKRLGIEVKMEGFGEDNPSIFSPRSISCISNDVYVVTNFERRKERHYWWRSRSVWKCNNFHKIQSKSNCSCQNLSSMLVNVWMNMFKLWIPEEGEGCWLFEVEWVYSTKRHSLESNWRSRQWRWKWVMLTKKDFEIQLRWFLQSTTCW